MITRVHDEITLTPPTTAHEEYCFWSCWVLDVEDYTPSIDGPEAEIIRNIRASHPFTLAGERRALELSVMLESAARIEHGCHFDDLDSEGKEKVRHAVALRCARLGLA